MNVLITGAAGYALSGLVALLLKENYTVTAYDNGQRNNCDSLLEFTKNDKFAFIYGNVNDKETLKRACEKQDIIVHGASCVGMPITNKYTEYSQLVNVEGTKNLAEVADKKTPIIFASSGSVYGALKEHCTEECVPNPLSPYGKQKLDGENILLSRGNSTCFRFSTAFGVSRNMRIDLLPNELVYNAVKCKSLTIFEADSYRTFIHLSDYHNSILHAIKNWNLFHDRVFNVGCENNNKTKRQLAELIKEKTGCSVFYADHGYKDCDARDYYVKFDRIESTGFKCKISIEDGVNELINAVPLLDIGNSRYRDKLL